MRGKKLKAWEEAKPVELKDISLDAEKGEPIHLLDIALGAAIGALGTLLCVWVI